MTHLDTAKNVIAMQASALQVLADELPQDFSKLIDYILKLQGRVIMIGMGKSSYMAKKIAASLASTGTPSFFIHPAEASHGDLGMITDNDMVIMLSNSGETKELFDTLNYCKRYNIKIAAITMKEKMQSILKSKIVAIKVFIKSVMSAYLLVIVNFRCHNQRQARARELV